MDLIDVKILLAEVFEKRMILEAINRENQTL